MVNILNTGQVVTSTLLPTDMKVSNISFPTRSDFVALEISYSLIDILYFSYVSLAISI